LPCQQQIVVALRERVAPTPDALCSWLSMISTEDKISLTGDIKCKTRYDHGRCFDLSNYLVSMYFDK
jgi:hypothetical protein